MSFCENPYMRGSLACPCGKCEPCTSLRKGTWSSRISLESFSHENSAFVTLTFNDENLQFQHPETNEPLAFPTVNPKDPKNFLKRLRKAVSPHKLRYYLVGEYGDKSWRPHYHLALFGYEPCYRGETRKDKHAEGLSCCPPCDLLLEKWSDPQTGKPYGGIDNAKIEKGSANYIAGYIQKKLNNKDDPTLDGRYPEFKSQSTKPGLGSLDLEKVAQVIKSEHGHACLTEYGDVPHYLQIGTDKIYLGRYLRDKLRLLLPGLDTVDPETGEILYDPKKETQKALEAELRSMWKNHANNPKATPDEIASLKHFVMSQSKQKILNFKSKSNLNKKEKKL